jgi:3-oxoacyl-[acyl-carrier-protein] synthase II
MGDVSSLLAVAEAADVIRRDQADVMIVGGTGSRLNITDFIWHGSARLAVNGKLPPVAVCRPFDAMRSGMVYGEGAAQVVLESRKHAEARGARPLARIAATASRCELVAEKLRPTGDAIRRAIRAAVAMSRVELAKISYVNAHGNSTREDDAAEAQAIRAELGDMPVTGMKSYFGNLGPGSGMVELVAGIIAMQRNCIPPTLNYEKPDPECPVNVNTELRPAEAPAFIKLNHNSTGQAVAVVVGKD